VSFGSFLGLAGGSIQHHWQGIDGGARGAVEMTRFLHLDFPMQAVSILGSPSGLIPLIVVASLLLWHYRRHWALVLPVVMLGTGGLQLLSKWAVDRPRPNLAAWGFPSGHVLSLVVFLGLLIYLLSRSHLGRTWRWIGAGIGGGVLLAVAFSRLYLDMHWLSDVCGGFALGLAYLLAVIWVVELATHRRLRQGLSAPAGRDTNDRSFSNRARISSLT
jgi:membrane-associated phospholipid phosphatase